MDTPKLEVKASQYGRGVFAVNDIPEGTVIRVSPTLRLKESEIPKNSTLWAYVFASKDSTDVLTSLDITSLINHNEEDTNVAYKAREDDYIEFTACKDIKAGDELYINYGYDPIEHNLGLDTDSVQLNDAYSKVPSDLHMFSTIKSKLEDAPNEIKNSFNEILNFFSYQEGSTRLKDIKELYSTLPKDLVFRPNEVGYLRWIKKNNQSELVQDAINLATVIVDIDTPICLALFLRIYSDIKNNIFNSLPESIVGIEGAPNKRLITLKLNTIPEPGLIETLKAKEWSVCLDTISQYSLDELEDILSNWYDISGLIETVDLEGNKDWENFKLTKRSKYDIVLLVNKFSLSDLAVAYKEIRPFNEKSTVTKTEQGLEYLINDVPLVKDIPNPTFKIPSNSGLLQLADYLATAFSRCQGRIFINIIPLQGEVVSTAKVVITLVDEPSLSCITISNKDKSKILFK
jgi:hypothetical protein